MAAPATTASLLGHPHEWTLEEYLALPEDHDERVELIDGSLHVTPAPSNAHQDVLGELHVALRLAAPKGCKPLLGPNVRLATSTLLIPDLIVSTSPSRTGLYNAVDTVLVAVEIISPSSRTYDKGHKRLLYAEAGVPFYWLVNPAAEPVSVIAYRLDGDEYREYARSQDGRLAVELPFPVTIDLTDQGA